MAAKGIAARPRATLHRSTIIFENEISYISVDPSRAVLWGLQPSL